jgi:hypothetical protein
MDLQISTPVAVPTDAPDQKTDPSQSVAAALASARQSGVAPAGWIERRERTSSLESRHVAR